jgi:hypothetical protein
VQYACYVKTGRSSRLGTADISVEGPGVGNEAIAGRFVAYRVMRCPERDHPCAVADVRVIDTRTGKTTRSRDESLESITDLAVSSRGSAAYIAAFPDGHFEVRRFDSTGDVLLDSGADIGLASLAATEGGGGADAALYWLRGGVAQTHAF